MSLKTSVTMANVEVPGKLKENHCQLNLWQKIEPAKDLAPPPWAYALKLFTTVILAIIGILNTCKHKFVRLEQMLLYFYGHNLQKFLIS
jgi:hypothetical protein